VLRRLTRFAKPVALGAVLVLAATACGGDDGETNAGSGGQAGTRLTGTIRIDGSSTVAPLSETAAEMFQKEQPGVQVTVGTSGTGGGFEKFCNGETDISDASRPIKQSEIDICTAKGIRYDQLTVANDGLAVVVSPANDWARCLTVDQLKKVWAPGSTVSNWRDIDPSFPDERLQLFGAGTDSGTFDYFTEAINGRAGASRTDYNATEDDNVTISGVAGTKGGLGYLGLSYVEESGGKVKALQINGGGGCIEPTTQTVQNNTYKPLGRPLFIYPKAEAMKRPEVQQFVRFYLDNVDKITEEALFVPLTQQQKTESVAKLQTLITS
jgi:phosphate transport system substrate-binding protein